MLNILQFHFLASIEINKLQLGPDGNRTFIRILQCFLKDNHESQTHINTKH